MKKLRVVHYPQIPCSPFIYDVLNEREAYVLVDALAKQHLFLYDQNMIPDYSNAIIVEQWDEIAEEWEEFFDEGSGLDFDEYVEEYKLTNQ